jgi:enoyl-[acyl-carrier-protein] reductase (NADH)
VVPGYGGGMSSAKAQLESDTKVLSWEAGRKYGVRVNTISAGPLASRAVCSLPLNAALPPTLRGLHVSRPVP